MGEPKREAFCYCYWGPFLPTVHEALRATNTVLIPRHFTYSKRCMCKTNPMTSFYRLIAQTWVYDMYHIICLMDSSIYKSELQWSIFMFQNISKWIISLKHKTLYMILPIRSRFQIYLCGICSIYYKYWFIHIEIQISIFMYN